MKLNIDFIYPIGSIYMSVNNINPSTLFGGTWEIWGSGRVPVGVDASDSDFNTVEKIGGHKEMQKHRHDVAGWRHYPDGTGGNYNTSSKLGLTTNGADGPTNAAYPHTEYYGAGDSGNLQPYITCYMWKRTA